MKLMEKWLIFSIIVIFSSSSSSTIITIIISSMIINSPLYYLCWPNMSLFINQRFEFRINNSSFYRSNFLFNLDFLFKTAHTNWKTAIQTIEYSHC